MAKNLVYTFEEIDYALINWTDNTYTPWVAAWGYMPETGNWCQGHYFRTKEDAMCYIGFKYQERFYKATPREKIEDLKEGLGEYGYKYTAVYDGEDEYNGVVTATSLDEAYNKVEEAYKTEGTNPDIYVYKLTAAYFNNNFFEV